MAVPSRELHRIVPTVIIYNSEKKYLITKRSEKLPVFPGRWTVPGGGLSMDDYETMPFSNKNDKQWYFVLEKGLRREVKEEVNLEIGIPEYLLDLVFIRPDNVPVVVLTFIAPYVSGEIVLNDGENTEFQWINAAEAKDYDFVGDIAMEIELADKRLQEQ